MVLGFMQLRAISIMIKCHRRRFKWQDAGWISHNKFELQSDSCFGYIKKHKKS